MRIKAALVISWGLSGVLLSSPGAGAAERSRREAAPGAQPSTEHRDSPILAKPKPQTLLLPLWHVWRQGCGLALAVAAHLQKRLLPRHGHTDTGAAPGRKRRLLSSTRGSSS